MLDMIKNMLAPGTGDFDRATVFAPSYGRNDWVLYPKAHPYMTHEPLVPVLVTPDDITTIDGDPAAYDLDGYNGVLPLVRADGAEPVFWNAHAMLLAVKAYLEKKTGVELRDNTTDEADNLASMTYGNVEVRIFLDKSLGIGYCLGKGIIMTQYPWDAKERFLLDARDALVEQDRILRADREARDAAIPCPGN